MQYRYLDDFRRGISVFAIFSHGVAVLGTPQCPPPPEVVSGSNRLQTRLWDNWNWIFFNAIHMWVAPTQIHVDKV